MRSSGTSTLASVTGFVLVAIVVLGGMTWATVSTYQLAKINVEREHRTRISKAVYRMDSYMSGVLGEEMSRPFTHYWPFYTDVPVQVWLDERLVVEGDRVVLQSPIAKSPPRHAWIDMYFQADEDGNWSSPQTACCTGQCSGCEDGQGECRCVDGSLERLRDLLPLGELSERVARAGERDVAISRSASRVDQTQAVKMTHRRARGDSPRQNESRTEYDRRGQRKRAEQLRSRPESECVNPEHGPNEIADIVTADRDVDDPTELASVGVYGDAWATFWIDPTAAQPAKLAFVRTGHMDADLVYQGFIGDWSLLKTELLTEISDVLDDADLEPAPDDALPDPQVSDITMHTIPVRLNSPRLVAGAVSRLAWRSVRGILLATWAAAAAILAVAGIGFRNLIAQSKRRMQFAYAVTHELRTPLTTFRLYSDMLSAGLVPDTSKQEYLDTLNRESQRLSSLVEGVLEFARLENHRIKLNPVETEAGALLRVLSEALEAHCAHCGVEPRTQNDLPGDLVLRTDVEAVNRIAGVLINNACRHAQQAEKPIVVTRLARENGRVFLDVIDSGPGIDHHDARAIFKPFRRGRGADAAAQGGIGLGLALARSWATLLGGRVDLIARHHREYGGAHFRLTFPPELGGRT